MVPGHVIPFWNAAEIVNDPVHPDGRLAQFTENVPPEELIAGAVTVGVPQAEVMECPKNNKEPGNASVMVTFVAPAGMVKYIV
ncbi:hypothetical protein MASR1M45_22120 [Candidatus Kapaibacterium sp.]